jgi:hypothetical protein
VLVPSQAIDVLGGATYGTPAGCVRHDPDTALALMQADPSDRAVKVTDKGIATADLGCTFISAKPEGRSWKVETLCFQYQTGRYRGRFRLFSHRGSHE